MPTARHRSLFTATAMLLALSCLQLHAQSPEDHSIVSRTAPNFTRPDLQKHPVNLSAYRGKVVLLNFWATWCGPCKVEIPEFMQWEKIYGPKGLNVLGVSMDDGTSEVISTVAKMKIDYPVLMGDGKLGNQYGGVQGLPVTFLIDRNGTVYGRYGSTDLPKLQADIRKLLQKH